jgi:hypothetical protein
MPYTFSVFSPFLILDFFRFAVGVVAVYVLNDEFKSIQREAQNGMSRASTYLLAKAFLVLPILFEFGIISLVLPSIVIQGIPWSSLGPSLVLYASLMFVFESIAEVLSVALDNPIWGMLGHVCFWFASFLFGGYLIPVRDMYMPFELFFHVMPFGYYLRSIMYITITETDWIGSANVTSAEVLETLSEVFPVISGEDTVWQDILILIGIGAFWKLVYVVLFMMKVRKVATIHPPSSSKKSR